MKKIFILCMVTLIVSVFHIAKANAWKKELKNLLSEKDSLIIAERQNKNLVNIDVTGLSFSASYARQLKEKWYLGGGLGFLPAWSYAINGDFSIFEVAKVNIYSLYLPSEHFQLESGIQLSMMQWGGDGENEALFGEVLGFYCLPAVGFKHLKIGPKFVIGVHNFYYEIFYITPLMLRISLQF